MRSVKSPKHLSNRQLLTLLRSFSKTLNHQPLTTTLWDAQPNRPVCSHTYIQRFGTWRAALKKIGHTAKAYRLTHDELLAALETAHKKARPRGTANGPSRPLRPADIYRHSPISRTPLIRTWGSPLRACHLYNLYHQGHITRQELFTTGPAIGQRRPSAGASLTLRFKILKRDNYKCRLCGRSPATNPTVELEVDQIHPISRGGQDHESNLQTLCRDCNQGKKAAWPLNVPRIEL